MKMLMNFFSGGEGGGGTKSIMGDMQIGNYN